MSDSVLTTKNVPTPGTGVVTGNPGGGVVLPEEVTIEARPLVGPAFTNVVSKNPSLAFRYVLRTDPNKSDGSRIRYNEALAMGFAPAIANVDCTVPGLAPMDTHYIYGDLILMKIDKCRYEGAKLYNEVIARKRANMNNIAAATRAEIPSRTDKISVILPDDAAKFLADRDKDAAPAGGALPLVPKRG